MSIIAFDHVAIPTVHPDEMLRFYRVLGFSAPAPEDWCAEKVPFFSIQFGENKINVHAPELWQNENFTLRGRTAQPGCGDFCFVWSGTLADLQDKLDQAGAVVVGCGPANAVPAMELRAAEQPAADLDVIAHQTPAVLHWNKTSQTRGAEGSIEGP